MLDGYDRSAEQRLDAAEAEQEQDWMDQLELEQRASDARRAVMAPALRTELASLQATGQALLAFVAMTTPTSTPSSTRASAPLADETPATPHASTPAQARFPTWRDIEDPYSVAYLTPGRVR